MYACLIIKDQDLDSNTHATLFLNSNDSPMSIKPLKLLSHWNI